MQILSPKQIDALLDEADALGNPAMDTPGFTRLCEIVDMLCLHDEATKGDLFGR